MPEGHLPRGGGVLVRPDPARTLRGVAAGGREEFSRGDVAHRVCSYGRHDGALFTERDLAEHRADIYEPISTTYRGLTVCTTAPRSQGIIVLEMLNILEGFAPTQLRWGTPDGVHLMVEAKKVAVADRLAYLGDPRFHDNPLAVLQSKEYAARRRGAIDLRRAQTDVAAGIVAGRVGGTTSFFVAGAQGDRGAFITSLSGSLRCGGVVEGNGILLNHLVWAGGVVSTWAP